MRRVLVLLVVVLAVLAIAPTASSREIPTVCGTLTGRDYALMHIVVETPGHVPGEHRGCAGFPF